MADLESAIETARQTIAATGYPPSLDDSRIEWGGIASDYFLLPPERVASKLASHSPIDVAARAAVAGLLFALSTTKSLLPADDEAERQSTFRGVRSRFVRI